MLTLVIFALAVLLYVVLLLWCLAPLVRAVRPRWAGWLRVALAALLIGANILPPLAWPIIVPIAAVDLVAAEKIMAVVLFPRTLPKYVANILNRTNAIATVVEITYRIGIEGVRYAFVVRTACTRRDLVAVDKGIDIQTFSRYPTASGGELSGHAGGSVIALDQSQNLCSMVLAGEL